MKLPQNFVVALKEISEKVKHPWTVIGSTALLLQGMDVQPNDLDSRYRLIGKPEKAKSIREHLSSAAE